MTRRILIGIILLSVLFRAAAALALGDNAMPVSGAADQLTYDTLAQRVLQGYGFSFPTVWYPYTSANEPTAHWSYLYTLYLAGVYAVFGHHPIVARLIQVLISALNIWLAYRIGRRIFGEAVGLAAAAVTGAYAYLVFFNAALMTQTFYVIAVLAAIDVSLQLAQKQTWQGWVLLGISIGVGTLIRQTLLLFSPILFLYIAWANKFRLQWQSAFLSVVLIGSSILPFTIFNYLTYHDFLLLNSNGGVWFYSSNHPNQGTNFDPNYVAPLPENLIGMPEPALDRALYREAISFIVSDPLRFVLLSINRTKDYFWLMPSERSSAISNVVRLLSFGLYAPFMLVGLYLSRRQWRLCLPLYLYAAFDTVLCLISWAAPRYRLPTDAALMVVVGLAVVGLAKRARLIPESEEPVSVS